MNSEQHLLRHTRQVGQQATSVHLLPHPLDSSANGY